MKQKIKLLILSALAVATLGLPLSMFNSSMPAKAKRVQIAQGAGLERGIYTENPQFGGRLLLHAIKGNRSYFYGPYKNLIVDAGETALRDCFGGTGTPTCTPVQNFKFHGLGTSAAAPAEANTGCTTELTTAYNPDGTRATGSQTNNGANVYRTVGTNTVDGTAAVTEFCLMSQALTGGTPWTRVTFTVINLAASDSLQTTYDLTIE